MRVTEPHPWNVDAAGAIRIQKELRPRIVLEDRISPAAIGIVAGADNGYTRRPEGETAYAAVPALSFPDLTLLETAYAAVPIRFPYVPGLLSFREAPALVEAFRRLAVEPDVILFDGQGIAHRRRMGLAAHLGLVLDKPSIGCAKSKLIGRYEEPGDAFGDWTPLLDRDEVLGAALRTKPGHSPLFVSPGFAVSLPAAIEIVLACCRGHFLPEPTRLAHDLVTAYAHPERARR